MDVFAEAAEVGRLDVATHFERILDRPVDDFFCEHLLCSWEESLEAKVRCEAKPHEGVVERRPYPRHVVDVPPFSHMKPARSNRT